MYAGLSAWSVVITWWMVIIIVIIINFKILEKKLLKLFTASIYGIIFTYILRQSIDLYVNLYWNSTNMSK